METSHMSLAGLTYPVFSQAHKERMPVSGTLELTFRCNYSCVHCYCNLPANDSAARKREMTFAEIDRISTELVEMGTLFLLITGGEPLLRPDFRDIWVMLKGKGFLLQLFTNGSLITEKMADFLVEYPAVTTEITLYGGTKETYERVTGVPGSYEKCLRGIDYLLERNLPFEIKTVAMRYNMHEIQLMKQMALNWGMAEFRFDPHINARLDGSTAPFAQRLTPKEVVQLDIEDGKRSEAYSESFSLFCTGQGDTPQRHDVFTCGAGATSYVIDPFGVASPCQIARLPRVDLRKHSFAEAWNGLFFEARQMHKTGNHRCENCDVSDTCVQCAGWSQLEHGDYETPVDFVCDINQLRSDMFTPKTTQRSILLQPASVR